MPLEQWKSFETTRTEQGLYLQQSVEGPVSTGKRQLWGVRVIPTPVITGKVGYLVDFAGSTRLYERTTFNIKWGEYHTGSEAGHTGFETNETKFRGEGRYGFATLRPKGVVKVSFEA